MPRYQQDSQAACLTTVSKIWFEIYLALAETTPDLAVLRPCSVLGASKVEISLCVSLSHHLSVGKCSQSRAMVIMYASRERGSCSDCMMTLLPQLYQESLCLQMPQCMIHDPSDLQVQRVAHWKWNRETHHPVTLVIGILLA